MNPAAEVGKRSPLHIQTVRNLAWSGASQGIRQLLQIAVSVVLARLLAPHEFGLLGMALVFIGFAQVFSDLGLGAALVQRREVTTTHLQTALTVQLLTGMAIALLLVAVAPLLASFYQQPRLSAVVRVSAANFLLLGLAGVPLALLQKEMAFRRLALIETSALLLSGTTAIAMAAAGCGLWSLVVQSLVNSLALALFSWLGCGWRPTLALNRSAWRDLSRFGRPLTGFNILNYWIRNLDNLLIGRFIGSAALGLYSRAYNLMLYPVNQLGGAMSRVMFPTLSSIQEDPPRIRAAYLRAARLTSLVSFPLMAGLSVLARPFIVTVFGPAWQEAAAVLSILSLVGLLQSVGYTLGWLYTSCGRTDILFRWGLGAGAVYFTSFLAGLHWGIVGVAAAYAISGYLLLWIPSWTLAGRLIGLRFVDMVGNLAGTAGCTAAMAAGVWLLHRFWLPDPGWLPLLVQVAAGAAFYLALIHLGRLRAWIELRQLLRDQLAARRRAV